ncbi:MAG: dUTP diphosphatase [Candidatus Sumerlaeaceae bacterium]|nr:dUTP diphosphatase [Candidatus Sumerlaeaceae bacterium]
MQSEVLIKVCVEPEAEGLGLPTYATPGAAGADLRAAVTSPVVIPPGQWVLISTGLRLEIPPGYEAQVRPRSGLAARHGITCLNTPGTIDSDYRGVVQVILINHGKEPFVVQRGDRIAQLVIAPVVKARFETSGSLSNSHRGDGGFGHSGLG